MILTVTPNPAVDLTWHVDRIVPGQTHRVHHGRARAGGKGLNTARVLRAEGHDVTALATVGGGIGAQFREDLTASGITHVLIDVSAATRRSLAFVEKGTGEATLFNELGSALEPREATQLADEATRLGLSADAVAISGSLRPGFGPDELGSLVERLVAGTSVVVDTSGAGMLAAADAGAHVLKPNHVELHEATGRADPLTGARALLDRGAHLVVVSLGAEGLIMVPRDGDAIRARLRTPLQGNATGAGDAAVAAITAALAERAHGPSLAPVSELELTAMARLATAWSAAAVLMPVAGELHPNHRLLAEDVVVTRAEKEIT